MLTDSKEIEIISRALQKNIRNPHRSRIHFLRILEDFFSNIQFEEKIFLDLGPGQYDFGVLARERKASVYGIDHDPSVLELGKYKNFTVKFQNIMNFKASDFPFQFDGLFCKFSINAFWFFNDDEKHVRFINEIGKSIKPGGWAWIGPWNGLLANQDISKKEINHVLSVQSKSFMELGFSQINLTKKLTKYYGLHGNTCNRALFCLNLNKPKKRWLFPFSGLHNS